MNKRIMSNPEERFRKSENVIDDFVYMILHQPGVNASPENKDKRLPSVLRKRAQSKFDLFSWCNYIYHIYQD